MKTLKYILLLCFITCMMLSFANPSDSSLPPVPVGSARVGLKSTINGSKKDPQKYVPLNCFAVNNSSIQNSIPMTLDFTFTYNEFGCAGFASTPTLHTANGVIKLLPEAEMVHIDLEAEKLIATNINGTPTFARIIPHATSISTINGMTMTAAAQHYGLSPVEARRIIHIAQSTNNPNNLSVRVGLFTRSTIQAAYACNGGVDPDPIGGGDPYTESSRNGETRGSDGSTSSSLIADMDTWEVNVKIHIEVVAGMGVWNQTPYIGDWRINSVLQYFPENVAYDDYNRNVVSVPAFIGGINTQGSNYYNQSFYFDIYRQSSIIQHDCDLDPPHSNNNDDPIHLRQAFDVEPELAVDKLEIFPNPFSDYLTISGEWVGNTDLEMSLISMDGRSEDLASIQRLEESGVGQAFKYRLSKSGLPSGIYILHVKSGGKLISSRKIVKK